MSMFDNYQNLNPDYIPDNSSQPHNDSYKDLTIKVPEIYYSKTGAPAGYKWQHGAEFDLVLSLKKTVKVSDNAIIYEELDARPSTSTKGVAGQQAYNTVDYKSWTCVGNSAGFYIWVEDDDVIVNSNGSKEITFTPDVFNSKLEAIIYNFRWEPIHSIAVLDAADVSIKIDKDINDLMKPSTYYCVLKLHRDNEVSIADNIILVVM